MISDIIRSLLRSNTNGKLSPGDDKEWKQHNLGESTDSAMAGFAKLMLQGKTGAELGSNEKIDPRFKAHYDDYIRPDVEAFEYKRQRALRMLRKRCMMVIPLLLVIVILFLSYGFAGILGFIAALVVGWASWPVVTYTRFCRHLIHPEKRCG